MDAAAVLLERVLALAPGNGSALHVQSQLRTQTREANHIDELRRVVARPRLRNQDAVLANFALAKELEDVGEYAESFEALRRANALKRSALTYDVKDDVRAMQNVMAHYTKDALSRHQERRRIARPDLRRRDAADRDDARRADSRQPFGGDVGRRSDGFPDGDGGTCEAHLRSCPRRRNRIS